MREGRSLYKQRTKSIPLARLRDRIVYLAEQEGIESRILNEAYTSKASYLDEDLFPKSEFSGRRLKRGRYQTKSGRLIHADQNAALNRIQKGNPNAVMIGTKGVDTPTNMPVWRVIVSNKASHGFAEGEIFTFCSQLVVLSKHAHL